MHKHQERIIRLIEKMEQGIATEAELRELDAFYDSFEHKPDYTSTMDSAERNTYGDRLFGRISDATQTKAIQWQSLFRWAAAAAILLVAAIAGYFLVDNRESIIESRESIADGQQSIVDPYVQHNIHPGSNKAVLTLADGTKLDLSTEQEGIVVGNDGITYADGSTVLEAGTERLGDQLLALNTISTPRGGQYQIILPDGTKVTLNAASTLKYPSRFTGNTREVFLDGEGYFSVDSRRSAVSSKKPFIVKTKGQQTTVLGTEFNISAYSEEGEIRTTLVSGSVKVTVLPGTTPDRSPVTNHQSHILKPNEQSIVTATGIETKNIDTESSVAWKNGYFMFSNESIYSILRKMSRWYDVDIRYEQDVSGLSFFGIIPRSENISAVLKRLEKTGEVKFRIEGRRISVMR